MQSFDGLVLIPEPFWFDIQGIERRIDSLGIPFKKGSISELAPVLTPRDIATTRAFQEGNALATVDTPHGIEVDYEQRLFGGTTRNVGSFYSGPGYCKLLSKNMLEANKIDNGKHPVVITPRILVEHVDRIHARTFFSFWPSVISEGGMRAALVKDQPTLSETERVEGMVRNILSSLMNVYLNEGFCSDDLCFHSNPHSISETRARNSNKNIGCEKHMGLLEEVTGRIIKR